MTSRKLAEIIGIPDNFNLVARRFFPMVRSARQAGFHHPLVLSTRIRFGRVGLSLSARASGVSTVDFAKLQRSRTYDVLMRLPLAGWAIFVATVSAVQLARYVGNAYPALPNAVYAINIAMRLSTIAFLVLLAASVVLRERPTGGPAGSSREFPP